MACNMTLQEWYSAREEVPPPHRWDGPNCIITFSDCEIKVDTNYISEDNVRRASETVNALYCEPMTLLVRVKDLKGVLCCGHCCSEGVCEGRFVWCKRGRRIIRRELAYCL